MHLYVDTRPFGSSVPRGAHRLIQAITSRLPGNWLGMRTAILLRRRAMARLDEAGVDVTHFNLRLRLYPVGNTCEKAALYTPQLFHPLERMVLARLAREAVARKSLFTFIDLGANVGLFSLMAAQLAGGRARVLAIEPQPDIRERLAFNVENHPGFDIRPLGIALADREGEVDLFIDQRDRGGSRIGGRGQGESVKVRGRKLEAVLIEEGFEGADVMKVDISGSEDLVLWSFVETAAAALLPRVLLMKDSSAMWTRDVFALLRARGYSEGERSRSHVFFYLEQESV